MATLNPGRNVPRACSDFLHVRSGCGVGDRSLSFAIGVVHLTERTSVHGLEGEQGIVSARVRRWEVFRVEDHLELRAAAEVRPNEARELVDGSLVCGRTSALHVRDLEARLGTGQLLGAL